MSETSRSRIDERMAELDRVLEQCRRRGIDPLTALIEAVWQHDEAERREEVTC